MRGFYYLISPTILLKIFGSLAASCDNIFLSNSIFAFLRPNINLL